MSDSAALRVLHCPTDIGGNPTGLAQAERALGLVSNVAVFDRSPFGYPVDVDLQLHGRSQPRRLGARTRLLWRAIRDYDVIHFNFGRTLWPHRGGYGLDLPLLRAAGRRLFMTFQGCDARQTGYCRSHFDRSCCGDASGPGLCRVEDDAAKRAAIAYATRHCHRVFCVNPDLLRVVPGAEFVPYASADLEALVPPETIARRRVRIVHAPTNRGVKGTAVVLDTIDRLRERHAIELDLVEGLAHVDALNRYRDADLVIDQLRVGWYGGLAVEAMALGKPVVSFIREEDLEFVPEAMARELPVIRATEETLLDVLDELLESPERRLEIGRRSRRFVERWHAPARIAKRMVATYRDPARSFWADPEAIQDEPDGAVRPA